LLRSRDLSALRDVNLWRIPLILTLSGIALFGFTMMADVLDAYHVIHIPTWFTMGGIDDARAILSAMLGSVSTVLALIFSVALLVLSMVATLFGPRLLSRFLHDWVTQFTIGLFMATFVYLCLVFLVTHEDAHSRFVPQVSLITSWLLVVASFGFLVFYSHRIASSIQNPDLVARIVDDMQPSFAVPQCHGPASPLEERVVAEQIAEGGRVTVAASGYLQWVDHAVLLEAASELDATVHVLHRQGQFVFRGEALASVWPKARLAELAPLIQKHVSLGRHRVLAQDSEFGIAQIVEIAIRALSPAVNDTFTGVACVDWAGDALLALAEGPPCDGCWYDKHGKLRLRLRPLPLERLVRMAFDQIRQASADNPAVLIRILDTIRRIAPRMKGEAEKRALRDEADAVREAASSRVLVELDKSDVEAAWQRAQPLN
jgi:uncharacterized membrane protein